MNARENMLSLYRRTGYAFAPVEFSLCPAMQAKMQAATGGVPLAEYFSYPEGFARRGLGGLRLKSATTPDWRQYYPAPLHPDTLFNVYGAAREYGYEGTYHLARMHHPLAQVDSLEQMQAYPWPEWDPDSTFLQTESAAAHREGLPVFGSMACSIWETAWGIRDMTMLMMDMATDDPKAVFLLDKITEDSVLRARAYAEADVDVIVMGDDIGMQNTIMMSLVMYREWLKPRLAKVIAAAKAVKPDVLVHYHSCGHVTPFIPDLMEIGVDILNPLQPEAMDVVKVISEYGDRLSFNGTLGTQTTMPFGTPEDVRRVTWRNLELAGPRGGLLVCPTHLLEPEVPWENVEAYVRACKDFRG